MRIELNLYRCVPGNPLSLTPPRRKGGIAIPHSLATAVTS